MKSLVIGYGSIGRRHARILSQMGHEVAVVTSTASADLPRFESLVEGLDGWSPDYVVIANETRLHSQSVRTLFECDYQGITLVEKPLFASSRELGHLPAGPVYVGYNLRFHPVVRLLATRIEGKPIWTLNVYVGQYLPDWRPQSDYRQSYSARAQDGGVIRDLSHELDYVQMLAGRWRRVVAAGGHFSNLEIESEDAATLLLECERCPLVTVHLNYLDRFPSRKIFVNGPGMTIVADLITGEVALNEDRKSLTFDRDQIMRAQHLAALANDEKYLCGIDDAMATLHMIDSAHQSINRSAWVVA